MKITSTASLLAAALFWFCACTDAGASVDFGVDNDKVEAEATGGDFNIRVSAEGEWTAMANQPWITISPANGRGSVDCRIHVDSTVVTSLRNGTVTVVRQNAASDNRREISVSQKGFDYEITLDKAEVVIPNYSDYGTRYFDVKVKTNVDFAVEIPDNVSWLECEKYSVELDRGVRPREVNLRFNWKINSTPLTRPENAFAEIRFNPRGEADMARNDVLRVQQDAAEVIEPTRSGDSLALLGVMRSINVWAEQWDLSRPMNEWSGVQLWEKGMPGYTPEKEGRVRAASFLLFQTREPLPYEVQYLNVAEELTFFSNVNSFQFSLDEGEYLTADEQMCQNLKRLTISAYGLNRLSDNFAKLKNLEYLDLSFNSFSEIPSIFTPENFPKLHAFIINGNRRHEVSDLSNMVYSTDEIAGLYSEAHPLERMMAFPELDTLVLGINYLNGKLPEFRDYPAYSQEDINAVDTLPQFLVDNAIPKVGPKLKRFTINGNRFTGSLPDWILYHPALNWWYPEILVFSQEGRTIDGTAAGFDNVPVNMNYYYDVYTSKPRPDDDFYGEGD